MSQEKISRLAETLAKELKPMSGKRFKISADNPQFVPNLIENLEQLAAGHTSGHQDNHSSSPD
ncbi:MAG: hypothetical protein AAF293_03065 [Pseudomonadota bacterium]